MIQASGLIDQFSAIFQKECLKVVQNGFQNNTQLVNKLIGMSQKVTDKVHVTMQQMKLQKQQSQKQELKLESQLGNVSENYDEQLLKSQQMLETLEKDMSVNYSHKQFVAIVKDYSRQIYLLTATNINRYLKMAQSLFYNIIEKANELFPKIELLLNFISENGLCQEIQNVFTCLLIVGLKLSQPFQLNDLND